MLFAKDGFSEQLRRENFGGNVRLLTLEDLYQR
jgi:hypothetical protein